MAAQDPGHLVTRELLPHVHLLSTYRYPIQQHVDHAEVAKWLIDAPKIARNTAPFFWTYLDHPAPGGIYLTWQPIQLLGTDFASDGYVWAPSEMQFSMELGNGLVLELYQYEAGYRPGTDQTTTMSRQRFRLVPSKAPPAPNQPQNIDSSLWIVHYKYSEKKIPVQAIPHDQRIHNIINTRAYLHRFGQILRKEFMLSDRQNWPQLPLPSANRHPMYGAPPGGRQPVPQEMPYPTRPPPSAPPSKRQRQHAPSTQNAQLPVIGAVLQPDSSYDDDEDTVRGDMFDQVSPRELAIARFQQNHEWLEEVLSSPYRMDQIGFSDLGLGLKGELSTLTQGIFTAQGGDALRGVPQHPYTGRLDEGKAELFRTRVTDHITSTEAEIERMKAEHETAMEKFKSNAIISRSEKELRPCIDNTCPKRWRLEGEYNDEDESNSKWPHKTDKTMEDIVASVESALGRHARVVSDVKRVQDGGYQEPKPEPEPEPMPEPSSQASLGGDVSLSRQPSQAGTPHSGLVIGDSDIEMGGTAGSLLDQINPGGASAISTPSNFPTPQAPLSTIPSAAATPANAPSPHPAQSAPDLPTVQENNKEEKAADGAKDATPPIAPDQGTGSGDWVVVPKGGTSPTGAAHAGTPAAEATKPPSTKPASATGTPADDFASLADLDTAGEVMESLNNPDIGGGSMDIDMEDSNFGDAFHGMGGSSSNTPGGI